MSTTLEQHARAVHYEVPIRQRTRHTTTEALQRVLRAWAVPEADQYKIHQGFLEDAESDLNLNAPYNFCITYRGMPIAGFGYETAGRHVYITEIDDKLRSNGTDTFSLPAHIGRKALIKTAMHWAAHHGKDHVHVLAAAGLPATRTYNPSREKEETNAFADMFQEAVARYDVPAKAAGMRLVVGHFGTAPADARPKTHVHYWTTVKEEK